MTDVQVRWLVPPGPAPAAALGTPGATWPQQLFAAGLIPDASIASATQYMMSVWTLEEASMAVAATSTPLIATINDTALHMLGPFAPQLARPIILTLVATGASGTAQLLRSTDGGTTKLPITQGGAPAADYQIGLGGPFAGVVANERIWTETDAAATEYLQVQLTAGSLAVRLAQ